MCKEILKGKKRFWMEHFKKYSNQSERFQWFTNCKRIWTTGTVQNIVNDFEKAHKILNDSKIMIKLLKYHKKHNVLP